MSEAGPKVKVFGTRGSAEAYAIRDFLHRCDVPFYWVELTSDEQARTLAQVSGLNDKRLPVCVFDDGTRLEHAPIRQVVEKLGLFTNPSRSEYDLSIYGAGPAGLSAAVYGASEGLKTVSFPAMQKSRSIGWPRKRSTTSRSTPTQAGPTSCSATATARSSSR